MDCVENRDLHEALNVPQLSVGIDNFLLCFESFLAPSARHRVQTHIGIGC